ncbi:MAG: DUF4342 domain-containing protein [Chloroflexota bacterium]
MNYEPQDKSKNDEARERMKTVTEQIEVTGNQLVDRVKELVAEGNVRRLIFRTPDDKVMMEMTVTTGAVVGGVITLAAWWLAALGAIAALVARIRIEVVREVPQDATIEGKPYTAPAERPASTGKAKVRIEVEEED